ncbi:MAG TPA: phage tail protein [Aggregatilinea sp.]|uniref:phage tail protein n=1 Tax=Aggregatilinea sp. TaxID=2806333 RepID=UPI002C6CF3F4|nr:phage tail protein [Aggregatilinea sp.]HML21808.1 phage tail protein [Aggregatilinea sp.]
MAASVPVYLSTDDLPTPGQMGRLAVVSGVLYVDTGSVWQAQSSGGGTVGSALPVGAMIPYPVTTPPTGWLLCAGQPVSRTSYPDLFAAIGTTFGLGDGSTTFNLPDFRGRTIAGLDNMGGVSANRVTNGAADAVGGSMGEELHQLTVEELPPHAHPASAGNFWGNASGPYGVTSGGTAVQQAQTGYAGSNYFHNNMQPTTFMPWIIKT